MGAWKRAIGSGLLGGVVGPSIGRGYAGDLFASVVITVGLMLILSYLKEAK